MEVEALAHSCRLTRTLDVRIDYKFALSVCSGTCVISFSCLIADFRLSNTSSSMSRYTKSVLFRQMYLSTNLCFECRCPNVG